MDQSARSTAGERGSPTILWLDDPRCSTASLVGNKAAGLARALDRHRVPRGFCLPVSVPTRSNRTQRLRRGLRADLEQAYSEMGTRVGVFTPPAVVRSSGMDEDGTSASFAGQHRSELNVHGMPELVDAVDRCLASFESAAALAYRARMGVAEGRPHAAVLVQQMVQADVSAVVFSANPNRPSADEVVIDASWGLGPSLVEGTVTPDSYRVRRSDLALLAADVREKRVMSVAADRGTLEVGVPPLLRSAPVLDEDQARRTAEMALALERDLGGPVDVECAWAGDRLYLLQCRPVTTPPTIPQPRETPVR